MKRKLRKILSNIDYKNKIVLDLGTGLGSIRELSDLCKDTTLVGLSEKYSFVESQKQMVKSKFLYVVGEYKNLPFKSNCFDIEVSLFANFTRDNIRKNTREIYRTLRKDGDIRIISTYYYKMDNISIYTKNIRKVFDQYFENLKIKDISTNSKGHFITIIGGGKNDLSVTPANFSRLHI
jgi:ubiquinone/menaquinone biosynthesis C-methylase UbiE